MRGVFSGGGLPVSRVPMEQGKKGGVGRPDHVERERRSREKPAVKESLTVDNQQLTTVDAKNEGAG